MKNQNLQYFVGKVCTIFTHPINRNFKEENPQTFVEQPYHYFVGVIDSVDDHGVMVTQVFSGLKSYFFLAGLISIAEEEVLNPENEDDAKIINELKTANENVRETIKTFETKQNEFVNVDALSDLLKSIDKSQ